MMNINKMINLLSGFRDEKGGAFPVILEDPDTAWPMIPTVKLGTINTKAGYVEAVLITGGYTESVHL